LSPARPSSKDCAIMARRKSLARSSFENLVDLLNQAVHPASVVTKTANSLTAIMESSKGKDRLLSIIQYSADLYKDCMKDYIAERNIVEWPLSMRNAKSIKKAMSQGRKIFRLFKFMDEIANADAHFQRGHRLNSLLILQCVNDFFSFWYYVTDNIVWFASIGLIGKYIVRLQIKWKVIKDSISLVRNVIDVLMCVLIVHKSISVERRLRLLFRSRLVPRQIQEGSRSFETLSEILEVRRERVYREIDLLQNGLRIVMLIEELKLPGHGYISRPLVAVCGLFQSLLSVFKMLYEKPKATVVERKQARTEVS